MLSTYVMCESGVHSSVLMCVSVCLCVTGGDLAFSLLKGQILPQQKTDLKGLKITREKFDSK